MPSDSGLTFAPPFLATGFVPNLAVSGLNLVPNIVIAGPGDAVGASLDLSGYTNFCIWIGASAPGLLLQWDALDPSSPTTSIGVRVQIGSTGVSPILVQFGNNIAGTNTPYIFGRLIVRNPNPGNITLGFLTGLLCSSG